MIEHLRSLLGEGMPGFGNEARGSGYGERLRVWKRRRPSLPPILFVALAMWAGVAVCVEGLFEAPAIVPGIAAWLAVCSMGIVLLAVSSVLLVRRHVLVGCLVLGFALGVFVGAVHAGQLETGQETLLASDGMRMVRIARDARPGSMGQTAIADAGGGMRVRLYVPDGSGLLVGDTIEVAGGWKAPSRKAARSCWEDGIVATARVSQGTGGTHEADDALHAFRRQAVSAVGERADAMVDATGMDVGEAALFLQAVVLGHVGDLYATELYQAVKVDGLAHLVAVSGAHLVVVCGMLLTLLRRFPLAKAPAIALQVLLIAGYLVLTGAPVSAVRAAIMAVLGMLSFFGGRRPYALGALSCCIMAMLALDPSAAFSYSFILSAAATFGIVVFAGFFSEALGGGWGMPGLPEGILRDSIALTLSSSLATIPVCACAFGQVSLIAPLANVLAAPLFPLACVGGLAAIAAAVAIPLLGSPLLDLLLVVLQCACWVLEALSHIPFASCAASLEAGAGIILAVGIPAILWVAWPAPTWKFAAMLAGALCLSLATCACLPLARGDCITMLDVGQGDAILLQSEGRSLLIDTGNQDAALLEGLAACGAFSLDAVLVTHPDDDHCASLSALRGVVPTGEVLVARDLLSEDEAHCASLRREARKLTGPDGMVGLSVGDAVKVGRFELVVVGPDSFQDGGGNADSLVLRFSYDADGDSVEEASGLFTGDCEAERLAAYVQAGRVGDIDILKVGHHGSRAALDDALAGLLQPEIALVSVGEFNTYGHPAPETLERLEAVGSTIWRTDQQGAVSCYLRPDGIHVKASNGGMF